ncbi:putative F-box domain-containing protein [Medicago truncatula]|uniref:Putative F-box domain-containing protein n=1 Tax=Medicago truncatula TaxID=3880 RepID=A0A396GW66_MEDTR|nr:putative F-box domain-containing protein [Medicago truncatula]
MAPGNHDNDVNNVVSSHSFMEETTTTKRQKPANTIGTLTSPPPLPSLPLDLVAEILCRLPVKLLLQFRCVCKSFKSLISDHKFGKKHLHCQQSATTSSTFKILPPLDDKHLSAYSFGYDHLINNYKIVALSLCKDKTEVSVHTLGTYSWIKIHDFPYTSPLCGSGIFVNGNVNWLALDGVTSSCVIVSLDLTKESYQKLLPPNMEMDHWTTLGVLKDCLCIFASNDVFLNVWAMKEYGNVESWTKSYHIPHKEFHGLFAYTYENENDQLLMDFNELGHYSLKLVVYDFKSGTLKTHEIQSLRYDMEPEVYIESLISPCF